MIINNVIAHCQQRHDRYTNYRHHKYLVIHRISRAYDEPNDIFPNNQPIADDKLNGVSLANWFSDTRQVSSHRRDWRDRPGSYTGGRNPYHLLVKTDGDIDQMKILNAVGYHAIGYNTTSISMCFAGNFTRRQPTKEQTDTAILAFKYFVALGYRVVAHDSLKGGSADLSKQCPGSEFKLGKLIHGAELSAGKMELDKFAAKKCLVDLGFIF